MAVQDFTLSFTVDDLPFWIDNTEGKVGGKSTIHFVDQSVATAGAGGQSNFAGIPIVTFENVGGKATIHFIDQGVATPGAGGQVIFESGQFVSFGIQDIIYYGETAEINTDQFVFDEELFSGPDIETIGLYSTRRLITDHTIDATLDVNESWSVNVNTSAGADITITLPSGSPAGVSYMFVKTSNVGIFDVQVQPGELIAVSGVDITGITLDSVGAKANMVFDGVSRWISIKEN